MSYTVLRAMMRRMDVPDRGAAVPDVPGIWPLRPSDAYLHAVAAEEGLQLDAYPDELLERPPMAEALAAGRDRDTVA